MNISRFFPIMALSVICSACITAPEIDMTLYSLDDFRSELSCDRSSQCKTVLAGYGECGNFPKGAGEYFIYSTKIGSRNIRHLKRLAKESLPVNSGRTNNFYEEELVECTLAFNLRPPPLMCINNRCQVSYQ